MMRGLLCAAMLLLGEASANKTATWLDKRAKLIGAVYGNGVRAAAQPNSNHRVQARMLRLVW